MVISRTVDPTTEPITLTEAKEHLGVTIEDDDTRITALIVAAREWVENDSGLALLTQTWVAKLDAFPPGDLLKLPKVPIQSITSVVYVDTNGDDQTFTGYTLDAIGERIYLQYGEDWPSTRDIENAVTITYVSGYGDAVSDVKETIKQVVKLQVEKLYDRPGTDYLGAIDRVSTSLLNPYRDLRRLL